MGRYHSAPNSHVSGRVTVTQLLWGHLWEICAMNNNSPVWHRGRDTRRYWCPHSGWLVFFVIVIFVEECDLCWCFMTCFFFFVGCINFTCWRTSVDVQSKPQLIIPLAAIMLLCTVVHMSLKAYPLCALFYQMAAKTFPHFCTPKVLLDTFPILQILKLVCQRLTRTALSYMPP